VSASGDGPQIEVLVNGETRRVGTGATVEDVLTLLGAPRRGIAVALNNEVVHRAAWPATQVAEGDRVEVLTAASGG
jgi:sulfur carrier protein